MTILEMRDKHFVTLKRGGFLSPDHHRMLMGWAIACSEHVFIRLNMDPDAVLTSTLQVAREWQEGKAGTGEAIRASRKVHVYARNAGHPVASAVARSVGHAVATAHMADHSVGAALYALKAIRLAGMPVEAEKEWQISQLQKMPPDLSELIRSKLNEKLKAMKV